MRKYNPALSLFSGTKKCHDFLRPVLGLHFGFIHYFQMNIIYMFYSLFYKSRFEIRFYSFQL